MILGHPVYIFIVVFDKQTNTVCPLVADYHIWTSIFCFLLLRIRLNHYESIKVIVGLGYQKDIYIASYNLLIITL